MAVVSLSNPSLGLINASIDLQRPPREVTVRRRVGLGARPVNGCVERFAGSMNVIGEYCRLACTGGSRGAGQPRHPRAGHNRTGARQWGCRCMADKAGCALARPAIPLPDPRPGHFAGDRQVMRQARAPVGGCLPTRDGAGNPRPRLPTAVCRRRSRLVVCCVRQMKTGSRLRRLRSAESMRQGDRSKSGAGPHD